MFLSDVDIRRALKADSIAISPAVRSEDIRPAGIRVHLADTIAVPKPCEGEIVDFSNMDGLDYGMVELGSEGYVLRKREFILASTRENIRTSPGILAQLDGRSTLARVGVMVHCGSMVIDNVHDEARAITLEIANLGPYDVRLRTGDGVGMLFFSYLQTPVKQPANAQYRGQVRVTPPSRRVLQGA